MASARGMHPSELLTHQRSHQYLSQYTHVLNNEVRQIREAFREAERLEAAKNEQKNFKPGPLSITALVVGKRHHVRFFPDNMVGMHSKNTNCRPGLLVDTGVTSRE